MSVSESALLELSDCLGAAESIDVRELAVEVQSVGFKCVCCGECCSGRFGDNAVAVFPFEVRRIMELLGCSWEDVVVPAESDIVDARGVVHTFEWRLRRTGGGDCVFLSGGRCGVYSVRPFICSTYPFFLYFEKSDIRLGVCRCRGVGEESGFDECLSLASLLKKRLVVEVREAIRLFERFDGFLGDVGEGCVVVYDSEGWHCYQGHAPK